METDIIIESSELWLGWNKNLARGWKNTTFSMETGTSAPTVAESHGIPWKKILMETSLSLNFSSPFAASLQ